jgi:hypothetical protein
MTCSSDSSSHDSIMVAAQRRLYLLLMNNPDTSNGLPNPGIKSFAQAGG